MTVGHTALAAISVAAGIQNPWISLIVNFFAHPLVDVVPHFDPQEWVREVDPATGEARADSPSKAEVYLAGADVLAAAGLMWWVWSTHGHLAAYWSGALGAFLPDSVYAPFWTAWITTRWWYQWFHRLHKRLHAICPIRRRNRAWGFVSPLLLVGGTIWWFSTH